MFAPRIVALVALEAASLAVASVLHLSGLVHGHGPAFSLTGADVAEGVLCVAIVWGAGALPGWPGSSGQLPPRCVTGAG